VLSAADLGAPLGAQATLVQFSTEVCAYCGPTRELLTEVARERDGVAFVEIDAAARMDLTRRLHVLSTPTVLVLDAVGAIASRASGPPRKTELLTAVGAVLGADGAS
jgi:thioredoxin-like negative regulator of GroEL